MRIDVLPSVDVMERGRGGRLQVLLRIGTEPSTRGGGAEVHTRPPLAMAVVIDRSSSMRGRPLRHAAEATRLVASRLGGQDQLCVVTFDREVTNLFGPDLITPETLGRLHDRLDFLMTGYLTNLAGGLTEACKAVSPLCRGGMTTRVVVLTDGLPSYGVRDTDELAELAGFYHEFGIVISTIGLGPGFDQELLARLATRGGGAFRYAQGSDDLPAALGAELEELFALRAEGTQVSIDMTDAPSGMEVLHAYPARREGRQVVVEVGDIYTGVPRLLLLDFALPAAQTSSSGTVDVARITTRYQHPGGPQEVVEHQLTVDIAETADTTVRPEVRRELALVRSAQAERDAVRRVDSGDVHGAREILQQAAEVLRAEPLLPGDPALRRKLAELSDAVDRLRMGRFGATERKSLVASAWATQISRVEPLPGGAIISAESPPEDPEDDEGDTNLGS